MKSVGLDEFEFGPGGTPLVPCEPAPAEPALGEPAALPLLLPDDDPPDDPPEL